MDSYTQKTRDWLEKRYALGELTGHWDLQSNRGLIQLIYYAHQPVYGFQGGHCESGMAVRYAVTRHLLWALAHLDFDSVLDAGAAEGFTGALIRRCFPATVFNTDLSISACRRAAQLFQSPGAGADLHDLPFADRSIDVVVCSETLEHLEEPSRAIHEMLRVARKAVVITVPHEAAELTERNRRSQPDHAHIHSFDLDSFSGLDPRSVRVLSWKVLSPLLAGLGPLIDRYRGAGGWIDSRSASHLWELVRVLATADGALCEAEGEYHGVLAVFLTPGSEWLVKPRIDLDALPLLSPAAPPLVLQTRSLESILDRPAAPIVACCIDDLGCRDGALRSKGWGLLQDRSSRFQRVSLIFHSTRGAWIFPAEGVERPDVAAHFGRPEYRHTGFELRVDPRKLPAGRYRVGVYVRSPEGEGCCFPGVTYEQLDPA